jgi:general secretion pathway protein D
MSARLLPVCLILAALFAATCAQLGAKPPDLPVQAVEFKDSTPEPLPIPAETPRTCPAPKKADGPAKMVTKVYPVADLVIPVNGDKDAAKKTTEDGLMKLITTTVAPETWAAKGGAGTIDYYPLTLSLAVNQTPEIQEKIAEVLESLRRMQDVELAVELRFLCLSEKMSERLWDLSDRCNKLDSEKRRRLAGAAPSPKKETPDVKFLGDAEVLLLMEVAQDDMFTNVMQAPKITMFNGQPAEISVGEQTAFVTGVDVSRKCDQIVFHPETETFWSGMRVALQPVISADRRLVRLSVNATQTTLDSEKVERIPVSTPVTRKGDASAGTAPFTQFIQNPKFTTLNVEKTLTLPDGGTALLKVGKRTREVENACRQSILSEIPYLDSLFINIGAHKETECVLMMVTPRIIVDFEKEQATHVAVSVPMKTGRTSERGGSYTQEDPATCPQKAKGCCASGSACCAASCAKAKDCCASSAACCAKGKDCCAAGAACCAVCCEASAGCAKCAAFNEPKVTELLKDYYKACAQGHRADATALAVQALALDPMCFARDHSVKGH